MRFQEGDKVEWGEGRPGRRYWSGRIAYVVPANTAPKKALADANLPRPFRNYIFRDKARPHESYLIVTPAPDERRRPGVHWPRPTGLRHAE